MNHRTILAIVLTAAIAAIPPTLANHTQTDSGKEISFDHKTGNAFWVEVVLGGSGASTVVRVEAQDEMNRIWRTLEKKSWGAWGGSFAIAQGEDVRFRAFWSDGTQAVSCWFRHPEGAERCFNPPPPAGWRAMKAFSSKSYSGALGIAVADVDKNGRDEVFVPAEEGLFVHQRDASGVWVGREIIPLPGDAQRSQVAAGDLDGDGQIEVFSSGWGGQGRDLIYSHQWNGQGWVSDLQAQLPYEVRSLVVGDIEDDGDVSLYIGSTNGFSQQATYRMDRPPGGFYGLITLSTDAPALLAIGDANRDGDRELYAGGYGGETQELAVVDWDGFSYGTEALPITSGDQITAIHSVDGDRDGLEELYVLRIADTDASRIDRHSFRSGGWTSSAIALGPARTYDMLLADADNDGANELYTSDEDGRIQKVHWAGTAWSVATVAQAGNGDALFSMAMGDGEGDGRRELFAAGAEFTGVCCPPVNVHRISFVSTPTPPFDASFTRVSGSEWWVQGKVAVTGGTLARVDVRLDGGEWKPLTLRSWGAWAASYHIPDGTIVQLRATSSAGETDLSSCRQWIPPQGEDAKVVPCTEPGGDFMATFSNVGGNEWWQEVVVKSNQEVTGVYFSVDCGIDSHPMTFRADWGKWVSSTRVASGSKVVFTAYSGAHPAVSSQGYIWPEATPTSGC